MKKSFIICIYIFSLIVQINPQGFKDNSVAKVGDISISDDEFLERFEMTPGINRQVKGNIESQKIEFLFSLIAEKLWALESLSRSQDTTEVIKFATKAFEKMFIRDAMFQRDIKDQIKISDKELSDGLNRSFTKLYVHFLYSTDSDEIFSLHKFLEDGIPFDSILAESPEKDEQITPVEVVFGQMEENVEQVLFDLKPEEYSQPILTPDGWYIFYLVNKSERILSNLSDKEEAIKNVRKIIEARKLIEKQKDFYADFFKEKKVDIDPGLFEILAKRISALFEYKKKNFFIKDGDLINLESADLVKMEQDFGDENLNKKFILFEKTPILFRDYLRQLLFDGFNSKEYKINIIRATLDERIRRDIEKELLYREGLQRGYATLPEVKKEVEIWREYYLFQYLKDQFRDSVSISEDEIYSYYLQNNQPESYPMLVNIIEILTDSLKTADSVLAEIKNGADFKTLAQIYNKREWTQKTSGEYGLFAISQHGEIGRIASTMNVGDVYGPLKLDEGYSIFKLIDKQDAKIIPPKPFEKFKEQYRLDLTNQRLTKKIAEFTYNLAVKFDINLNLDLLENIKVTALPSFGIRFLGFGGKMTAVPLTVPNVDWSEKWIRNQQQPKVIP